MLVLVLCLFQAAWGWVAYDNYGFDYSAQRLPIAYTTYGNAVELNHKLKLNSAVQDRGGALVLNRAIRQADF